MARLPKSVRFWFETFKQEGENEKRAMQNAINRAFESGEISEATADRLEAGLLPALSVDK